MYLGKRRLKFTSASQSHGLEAGDETELFFCINYLCCPLCSIGKIYISQEKPNIIVLYRPFLLQSYLITELSEMTDQG